MTHTQLINFDGSARVLWMNDPKTINFDGSATVSCRIEKTDYGVPGSPVFDDITDLSLDSIELFGQDWTYAELVAEFGNQGAWAIEKHVIGMADDDQWSGNDE